METLYILTLLLAGKFQIDFIIRRHQNSSLNVFFDRTLHSLVAGAVADINRKVAEGDSKNTLQALQAPGAGLKMVLPECADTYQNKLAERQTNTANEGNLTCCILSLSSDSAPGVGKYPERIVGCELSLYV